MATTTQLPFCLTDSNCSQNCSLTDTLDETQPREHTGFGSRYSRIDHLHTIGQLMEKTLECNEPLCLAFEDYEKAFDSVEHTADFNSMREQGANENYIKKHTEHL